LHVSATDRQLAVLRHAREDAVFGQRWSTGGEISIPIAYRMMDWQFETNDVLFSLVGMFSVVFIVFVCVSSLWQ